MSARPSRTGCALPGRRGVSTESMTLHGRQAEATQEGRTARRSGVAASAPGAAGGAMATPPGSIIRPAASCSGPMRAASHWHAAPGRLPDPSMSAMPRDPATTSIWGCMAARNGAGWACRRRGSHWHALRVASGGVRRVRGRLKSDYRAGTTRSSATWAITSTAGGARAFVSAAYVNLRTEGSTSGRRRAAGQPDPLRCRQCLGIQRQLPSGAVWRRAMGPAGPAPGRGSHLACAARVASGGVRRVRGRAEVGLSRGDPGLRRPGLSHRHGGGGRRAFRQRGLCESANRKDRRAGAARRARGQDTGVGYTTLGLRASGAFTLGRAAATARASVGWRHALGDTTPASAQRFAGATRSRRPACRSRGMLR